MNPAIEVLAHDEERDLYAIRIPVGIRNPKRSDERSELEYERFALVCGKPFAYGSTTGPKTYIMEMFEEATREDDSDEDYEVNYWDDEDNEGWD